MSEITSADANLQAFTETMNAWVEHGIGRKDFDKCQPATKGLPKHSIPALETIFQGFCSFRSGTITPETWTDVTRIAKVLMTTKHFSAHWESRKDEFSQDFHDFMRRL